MKANSKRRIKTGYQFDSCFETPKRSSITTVKNGGVEDTIQAIIKVSEEYSFEAKKIAKKLEGSTLHQTLENIYNFCYNYFQYKEDEYGFDTVRTPNRAWADRFNGIDCDCYSAIISCILRELQIPHTIRMSANFKPNKFNHVYVIVIDKAREICIDPVKDQFDDEEPLLTKKDYPMEIQVLNGLNGEISRPNSTRTQEIINWIILNEIRNVASIRRAISVYATKSKLRSADIEKMLANLMYQSDTRTYHFLATKRIQVERKHRNYTINDKQVLAFIGLTNSNAGLLVALLHDIGIVENWLEKTYNLTLGSTIAHKIQIASRSTGRLEIAPIKSYLNTNRKIHETRAVVEVEDHVDDLIHDDDPMSNCLQLSVIINQPKGQIAKAISCMHHPDGSVLSNRIHNGLSGLADEYGDYIDDEYYEETPADFEDGLNGKRRDRRRKRKAARKKRRAARRKRRAERKENRANRKQRRHERRQKNKETRQMRRDARADRRRQKADAGERTGIDRFGSGIAQVISSVGAKAGLSENVDNAYAGQQGQQGSQGPMPRVAESKPFMQDPKKIALAVGGVSVLGIGTWLLLK